MLKTIKFNSVFGKWLLIVWCLAGFSSGFASVENTCHVTNYNNVNQCITAMHECQHEAISLNKSSAFNAFYSSFAYSASSEWEQCNPQTKQCRVFFQAGCALLGFPDAKEGYWQIAQAKLADEINRMRSNQVSLNDYKITCAYTCQQLDAKGYCKVQPPRATWDCN